MLHIAIVALLFVASSWSAERRAVVAKVDGVPITKEEFSFALAPYTASLHRLGENNMADTDESSRRILKQVLERSIETKMEQLLAREHLLIGEVSYEAFVASLQRENEQRQTAYKKGEVFYGPVEFTELAFFEYQISNIVASLEKMLGDDFDAQMHARKTRARIEIDNEALDELRNNVLKRK